jgi:hypothetical protein
MHGYGTVPVKSTKRDLVELLERIHGELMVKYCWGEPYQVSEKWLKNRLRRIEKLLPHLTEDPHG